MKNLFKIGLVVIILTVIGGAFYWYEWLPSQIRMQCNSSAFNSSVTFFNSSNYTQSGRMELLDLKDKFYRDCLKDNGLEK